MKWVPDDVGGTFIKKLETFSVSYPPVFVSRILIKPTFLRKKKAVEKKSFNCHTFDILKLHFEAVVSMTSLGGENFYFSNFSLKKSESRGCFKEAF